MASVTFSLYQVAALPVSSRAAIASAANTSESSPSLLVSDSIATGLPLKTFLDLSCNSRATYPVLLPVRGRRLSLYRRSRTDRRRALPRGGSALPATSALSCFESREEKTGSFGSIGFLAKEYLPSIAAFCRSRAFFCSLFKRSLCFTAAGRSVALKRRTIFPSRTVSTPIIFCARPSNCAGYREYFPSYASIGASGTSMPSAAAAASACLAASLLAGATGADRAPIGARRLLKICSADVISALLRPEPMLRKKRTMRSNMLLGLPVTLS